MAEPIRGSQVLRDFAKKAYKEDQWIRGCELALKSVNSYEVGMRSWCDEAVEEYNAFMKTVPNKK